MRRLLLYFLLALPSLSLAKPAWLSEINVTKPGPFLQLRPVELSFDLSWNGRVKAGTTHIRLGQPDPRYPKHMIAQSYGKTTGFARRLYQFDYNYTSFLNPKDFRPQVFVAEEKWSDEDRLVTTRFNAKGVNVVQKGHDLETGKVKTKTSSFVFPDALGVHSGVLWVRSLDLKPGQEAVFVVMPFRTPYLIRVKHLGNEIHSSIPTIKLDLKLQKIDRDTLQLKHYNKVKSFVLWLSDDADRLPIEFRSKVFIGDVRAVLTGKTDLSYQ